MTRVTITVLAFCTAVSLAYAQSGRNPQPSLACEDEGRRISFDNERQRFCEMREYPLAGAPRVAVDGRTNGGISIRGWNRSDMLVRAKVETWAPSAGEARSLARQVHVQSAGGNVRADAPEFGRDRGWAVSYEVFVPHATDLNLKAHNGGIAIAEVRGTVDFEGVNGGVSLQRLAGTVRGKTVNGGLRIELEGTRWDGDGLNVSATNGGVSLSVPENYSARLETRTVNGRISFDFPVTVQGKIGREMSLDLGSGGPLIRATTTNGGVSVKRKS